MKTDENFYHDKYGYCYYAITSDKNAIVFGLYVEREYRRMGHARRILQFVINKIKKTGYKGSIKIEAKPSENSIEIKPLTLFYKNMGLEILERL